MFSRSMRIGAVLLALAQLGVWGFYAPAHRLLHHSKLLASTTPLASKPDAATAGRTQCCSHHHHTHAASAAGVPESQSDCDSHVPVDSRHQCPDDEQHCGLCIIALQAGSTAESVRLTDTVARVEFVAESTGLAPSIKVIQAFDSRGPPAA
jgi:hypothetical protein